MFRPSACRWIRSSMMSPQTVTRLPQEDFHEVNRFPLAPDLRQQAVRDGAMFRQHPKFVGDMALERLLFRIRLCRRGLGDDWTFVNPLRKIKKRTGLCIAEHQAREHFVLIKVPGDDDKRRANRPRPGGRHRGVDAHLPSLIRSGGITPRFAPPTATGRRLSLGSAACSTDAKNASASRWTIMHAHD